MERTLKFTVIAIKWFDKVNGNTYHSVRCIRHKDNAVVVGQFQYGYGEHYRQTALEVMNKAGWLPAIYAFQTESIKGAIQGKDVFTYERNNNYPILWTVSDGLKRDCIANGKL